MLYTLPELLKEYKNEYRIRSLLNESKIFKIEHGLYTDNQFYIKDEVYCCKKYDSSIITLESAFSYYDLVDETFDYFSIATPRNSTRISNSLICQHYQMPDIINIGVDIVESKQGVFKIYNLERLLIETFRLKNKIAADIYKEVINSYRDIKDKLDIYRLVQYSEKIKNGDHILDRILEVIY